VGFQYTLVQEGGKVVFQGAMNMFDADFKKIPRVPASIKDLLKDTEQCLQLDVKLNTSPDKVMAGGPLIDHALGGFSVRARLKYLKNIKKILAKHPKLAEPMTLGGFTLKLGVKANVNLEFDDP
jgi:hypothetical protein